MLSILKGDCLDVMKTLPDRSIDCFVCDLPYGCLSGRAIGKAAEKKKCFSGNEHGCAWDVKLDLDAFWAQVKRLAKDDHTPILMFCNTKFGNDLINSNPKWFRYDLVWNKSRAVGFLSANIMPLRSHELIYVFSKKGAYYKRIDIEGDFKESVREGHVRSDSETTIYGGSYRTPSKSNKGVRCVKSVIDVSNEGNRGERHPTQKPAELYEWLLKRYCPDGGTILDPTAGSFTSCFVAKKLGLKAIGIEKDAGFFWKAVSRVSL
jgi:site-specific DNA-methyltransferase (adenine-specific)